MRSRQRRAIPRIYIPPIETVSPAEIERRRHIVEATLRLRQEIGPIDIPTDELIHEARLEEEDAGR